MSKVVLDPKPTFDLPVTLPLVGGGQIELTVTFKWRSPDDFEKFAEDARNSAGVVRSDAEIIMGVASGWNAEDEFTPEGVAAACGKIFNLGANIVKVYFAEYNRIRTGN